MQFNHFKQKVGDDVPEWRPRKPPVRQTLRGRFCTLSPLDVMKHGKALYEAYSLTPDDRDWTYLFSDKPTNRVSFANNLNVMAHSDDPLYFAVIDNATRKAAGTVAFVRIEPVYGVQEIGSVIWSPLLRRRAAGTEAIYLMLAHTFDTLGYRRCEWRCDSLNEASKTAAVRFGFTYEGTFRQAVVYKGRNRDTDWFAIIDSEWPALRRAYRWWLSPDNFDRHGKQIRPLRDFMIARSA